MPHPTLQRAIPDAASVETLYRSQNYASRSELYRRQLQQRASTCTTSHQQIVSTKGIPERPDSFQSSESLSIETDALNSADIRGGPFESTWEALIEILSVILEGF